MHPPSIDELQRISKDLGGAKMLLNPKKVDEPDYKKHIAGRELTDKEILQTLHNFPELLRKPILFNGERAVAGYVPERLESVVKMTTARV
jgi:arsenate reductase-like glutaredoxin family protein